MNVESWPAVLFAAVFVVVGGTFVYRLVKHGGLKGAAFGSKIQQTIGEVAGHGPTPMKLLVRVHRLEGADNVVGIEIIARSVASYQMLPVALSRAEAHALVTLIESAANERTG